MHRPVTPWAAREAVAAASSAPPILRWDGRTPTELIAQIEARLAAGLRFAVLAATPPLGRGADQILLQGWWRTAHPRLSGLCAGWAVLVPGADVNPGLLIPADRMPSFVAFPIRTCADQGEALWWLRARLAHSSIEQEGIYA